MQTTRTIMYNRATRSQTHWDDPDGIEVKIISGSNREISGYRILSDRQLLQRKSPTLPLVKPDPFWTNGEPRI